MLYANENAKGTGELSAALAALGVRGEDMLAFDSFMDMSKPIDVSLLANIGRIDMCGPIDWKKLNALHKAIKKELLSPVDEKKIARYICFIYAVCGSMCYRFIYDAVNQENANKYLHNGLTAGYGEDGAAMYYLVKAAAATMQYMYRGQFKKKGYELCLRAAELARDDDIGICLALIYALDGQDKDSADVKRTLALAHKVLASVKLNVVSNSDREFALVLAAEAGYFDKHYRSELFNMLNGADRMAAYRSLMTTAYGLDIDKKRFYETIESDESLVCPEYILYISDNREHRKKLAKQYTSVYVAAIRKCESVKLAKKLEEALIKSGAEYDKKAFNLQNATRVRILDELCNQFDRGGDVRDYICGQRELKDTLAQIGSKQVSHTNKAAGLDYYGAFGKDEFISRAVTVLMIADIQYGRLYRVKEYTGFEVDDNGNIKNTIDMMTEGGAETALIFNAIGVCLDDLYSTKERCTAEAIDTFEKYRDRLKGIDLKKMCATARVVYAQVTGRHPNEFKAELLALADDGSKAVREVLADILTKQKSWADDIAELLKAKKGAKRELALEVIAKQGADAYKAALTEAFEKEKSDKIKVKIGALIGAAVENTSAAEVSLEQKLDKLVKASKTAKYSFLFDRPFKPVHKKDGSEASEDLLRALVMCYSSFTAPERSVLADEIAAELDSKELEGFAAEVFGRWCDNGADSKQKSLLYFCAVHGGIPMVRVFMQNIKAWAESMRSAIAANAVKAMALGGSSEALMNIDNMSRKFKNKAVRAAAGEAMLSAADALGITTEELADRIVPDLGFDENKCREFDYGPRQFKVYITPTLELEIMNGDKKVKTLPKPGANDDPDKSKAAYDDFKELKKQLKNVITAQRARLEYVLMCDRKWTQEKWTQLFVNNAVMNCFAIGLIWGVYENGALKDTFRYMDDGSFTDMQGDEYTLPENAQIGLVHPIELTAEQTAGWKEQLEDFEITQPFMQLDRPVFLPDDKELKANKTTRFDGVELNSLTLVNKLVKLGWYKGYAEDAGWFYYFYRDDIARRTKNADGTETVEGNGAMLTFSGASIVVYDYDGEEVTTEKLIFYKGGSHPNYYSRDEKGFLKIRDVSPRYFSEIVMQLDTVLGKKEQGNK